MNSPLHTWLQNPDCLSILKLCADQIISRAVRASIVLEDAYLEAEDRDAYRTAIATDLWQFIKTDADNIAAKGTVLLVQNDEHAFMAFIASKYLDYCKDRRRSQSPFHDYYRKVRSVLSESEEVCYHAMTRVGAWYAFSANPDIERLPERLTPGEDAYSSWPVIESIYSDSLYNNPAIIKLARHFWDHALLCFLAEYFLPVRELVRFVFSKYPMTFSISHGDTIPRSEGEPTTEHSLENVLVDHRIHSSFDDAWKRQQPAFDHDLIDHHLEQIAQDCVAQLAENERVVLLALDEGKTLTDTASALGLKSASNVSYHQKKAYMIIHHHWSLWGPAKAREFSEVDEEEFFMFYEKLILICKNKKTCRDSRKGM